MAAPDPEPAALAAEPVPAVPSETTAAVMTADAPAPEPVPEDVKPATDAGPTGAELPDEFGREYLDRQVPEPESQVVTATVTRVRRDAYRRLHFHFENGQVWRQMERRTFSYPRGESFGVEITRGMLGDYQMRVGGEGRMTRIVRVQ